MRLRYAINASVLAIVTCLALTVSTLATADEQEDLAKESQNPIGNIISLPFENNFDFGIGPDLKVDGTFHRHRPSRQTGRRTVAIAGPYPSAAELGVLLNSVINR